MTIKLVSIYAAFLLFLLVNGDVNSHCVTLSCGNEVTGQKGEPGPEGEHGVEGPKGAKGEQGLCDPSCISAYNQLNEKVQTLESTVELLESSKNCKEALQLGHIESGVYNIYNPRNQQILEVYCDQTTDNGGWMRRTDGSENFYRTWAEYQEKFGNLSNEFWLGMENLHAMTRMGKYELRIELEDCEKVRKFAKYSSFSIGSAKEQYCLSVSGYSGNAGDSLTYHNGRPFTTKDVDNDSRSGDNCAVLESAAWWYGACYSSNLNGAYLDCQTTTDKAASWYTFHGTKYSLKFIEMKFRPI